MRLLSKLLKNYIPTIDNDFKDLCESTLTIGEVKSALFSMKRGKSPGVDGFFFFRWILHIHFWDLIKSPLFACIKNALLRKKWLLQWSGYNFPYSKTWKRLLIIDNWRPIHSITIDYKILAWYMLNRVEI